MYHSLNIMVLKIKNYKKASFFYFYRKGSFSNGFKEIKSVAVLEVGKGEEHV